MVSPLRVSDEYFNGFSFELNAAYLIYERKMPHTCILNYCKHIFVCAREYVYILIYARNFQPSWNYVVSQYKGQKLCLTKDLMIFKLCKKTYKMMKIPSNKCQYSNNSIYTILHSIMNIFFFSRKNTRRDNLILKKFSCR